MTHCLFRDIRRKAVWGSRRTVAALALAALAAASTASAEGRHVKNMPHATPGVPSLRVTNYKVDAELSRRAQHGNTAHTSTVIIELVPGATLPPEFRRFARAGQLDIINGRVLDLPDSVIAKLAAHPNIFRIHED